MSVRGVLLAAAIAIVLALGIFLLRETRRAPAASEPIAPPVSEPIAPPPAAAPVVVVPPPPPPRALPPTVEATTPPPAPPQDPQVARQLEVRLQLTMSIEIGKLESELRRAEQQGDADRARNLEQRLEALRARKRTVDEELR
jgi:hypothetical protein